MDAQKLLVNKISIVLGILAVLIWQTCVVTLYFVTYNSMVLVCGTGSIMLVFLCVFSFFMYIRRKLISFSDMLCKTIDDMLDGEIEPLSVTEEENLFYKINHRLIMLYEVMQENSQRIAKERADLQELISDISHQVKTPIANLKIINATLLEKTVPIEKQQEFLLSCNGQLDKLDFLMQAMVKTSRLETGVISLKKEVQGIYGTLADALGAILLSAERKNIRVMVDCPEDIEISHDWKWTSEAFFNILDNAVKYTSEGGNISVSVENWDMYLKIDITDTGKGIPEQDQGMIFKRFCRGEDTHDISGIGVGLYLAREIITMQGGYIKVNSEPGKGSTFSVFLSFE